MHRIVLGAEFVGGSQCVFERCVLQRETSNAERNVEDSIAEIDRFVGLVASGLTALSDGLTVDDPFGDWTGIGENGDVHQSCESLDDAENTDLRLGLGTI